MKRILSLALCILMLLSVSVSLAETVAQDLPVTADMYGMLDLMDPYKTTISGLFKQPVAMGEGVEARLGYVYIGAENRQSEPFVMLLPDSSVANINAFLEDSGWKQLADEQGLIVAVAQTNSAWADDEKYLNQFYTVTHARGHYNAQKGNNYMAAYGDAVTAAQKWLMNTPENFASAATFGTIGAIDDTYMAECAAKATKLPDIANGEIPMPIWFFVDELNADAQKVLAYWNRINNVGEEVFSTELATAVYMAKNNTIASLIDEQNFLAQTRYTVTEKAASPAADTTKAVWGFLSSVIRPVGFANNALRSARSVEEWGATRREKVIAGVNRYWVEFVPAKLAPTAEDGKVPLVVYSHGNNNTAESMLARSEFIKVANERGFIAILMTGCLYRTEKSFPNPRWNLEQDPNLFDDYAYIREAVADTVSRLPIDTTRIYAMGQSYGGAATFTWMLRMNDIFAAGAGTGMSGAALPSDKISPYTQTELNMEGNLTPICALMGQAEGGSIENEALRTQYPYWLERNGLNPSVDEALTGQYKSGRYNVYDFANEQGVPLVQYITVDERIHTIVASDLYFQYDTFLSKYSRGADGTVYYEGKVVEK